MQQMPPPMQPFKPFPPEGPPPFRPKAPLSNVLKAILALKLLSVLFVMGAAFIFMSAASSFKPPDENARQVMHQLANLALVAMGTSFVELVGIAGTWSMKRWGVYVLLGFSMLSIVLRMNAHDTTGAGFSAVTTLLVGAMIASRWNDFD